MTTTNKRTAIDQLILGLSWDELVHFARGALTDIIDDLALDDPPTGADGDLLPALERGLEALNRLGDSIETPLERVYGYCEEASFRAGPFLDTNERSRE